MSEALEVISTLGPLGSGKTTAVNQLIQQVPLGDSYAVVVNDVGAANIDAQRIFDHPANRSERVIPLTAGCIGCSDATQFREALERVRDAGVNVLFIEPTGIAPGHEIAEVVASCELPLSVLTLVNAQTVERDMRWQALPSQLAAANIVGITHLPDQANSAEAMATVLDQLPKLPSDVAVELITPGDTDYARLLARLRGQEKQLLLGRGVVSACMGGDCHHDHHHHDHGISAQSFDLRPDVDITTIYQTLMPYTANDAAPLLRAKGSVGGQRFDIVGTEWSQEATTSQDAVMNVIFGGHVPAAAQTALKQLSIERQRLEVATDKKRITGSVRELPLADRRAIIHERLAQYPAPISPLHGELVPDCEADEGYEIAFWRDSDDVPLADKQAAMERYISFRLQGLHELEYHQQRIVHYDEKQAYWRRRFGATLGYNGYYLAEYMSHEARDQVRQVRPGKLLADGFLALQTLTFDEGRAEEKPEFVAAVLRAAVACGDVSADHAQSVIAHGLKLSAKHPEWLARWQVVEVA